MLDWVGETSVLVPHSAATPKNNHKREYNKNQLNSVYFLKKKTTNILNHLETDAYDAVGVFSDGSDSLAICPRKTLALDQKRKHKQRRR